jgi:hypothetical protein
MSIKTSRAYITDSVHATRAAALAAFSDAMAAIKSNQGIDDNEFWNGLVIDNLPTIIDNGDQLATFGPDANGLPEISTAAGELGHLAIVTIWNSDITITQPTGLPLQTVSAIYLLQLPTIAEITTNGKLGAILNRLVSKAYLTAARVMAKDHAKDPKTAPLNRDRISALISATTTRAGKGPEEAFKALYPVLVALILRTVEQKYNALIAAGQTARAKNVAATFSKARLNIEALRQCLQSADAARDNFPSMPQDQWTALLKIAIEQAPKHTAKVVIKDDNGQPILDAEGKRTYNRIPAPQSPLFFQICLETRDTFVLDLAQDSINFDDMLAPTTEAAAA